MTNVLIGIQARSNSTRFKEKAYKMVGDLSIIHRIIYQCVRVAGWIQKDLKDVNVATAILIPSGDPLKKHVEHKIEVFEGSEENVLSRYRDASNFYDSDFVVRITGDCAWINSKIISKCLRDALNKKSDYTSNILVRTFIEGYDTEVMSKDCLTWLDENAKTPFEREHVTIKLLQDVEKHLPIPLLIHTILNDYDLSNIKTSIDTEQEYNVAIHLFHEIQRKKHIASLYGSVSH